MIHPDDAAFIEAHRQLSGRIHIITIVPEGESGDSIQPEQGGDVHAKIGSALDAWLSSHPEPRPRP